MAFDVGGRGQSCGARMTHVDNQGPISNQAVNLYFSGGAYLPVRMKIAQSGSPGLDFGDIAAVFDNLILDERRRIPWLKFGLAPRQFITDWWG
jgi:hypothetical protein